jgi:hypothetical protein
VKRHEVLLLQKDLFLVLKNANDLTGYPLCCIPKPVKVKKKSLIYYLETKLYEANTTKPFKWRNIIN